jgi:hypothetical protein
MQDGNPKYHIVMLATAHGLMMTSHEPGITGYKEAPDLTT